MIMSNGARTGNNTDRPEISAASKALVGFDYLNPDSTSLPGAVIGAYQKFPGMGGVSATSSITGFKITVSKTGLDYTDPAVRKPDANTLCLTEWEPVPNVAGQWQPRLGEIRFSLADGKRIDSVESAFYPQLKRSE
jgi:hypothetical protein